jgi:1,3-beta-glucan synthase
VINTIVLVIGFGVSCFSAPLFMMCCTKKNAGVMAAFSHLISVLIHLILFEVIWYLEGWNFSRTLVCILCVIDFQDFFFKFVTIVLLSKELKHDLINRSWWSGNWFNRGVGWRFLSQPLREFIVKIMEMSLFAADFILGHCLLFIQTPLVFIPFIDSWHSMILFWLRPSKQLKGRILTKSQMRRRNVVVVKYFVLYFLIFSLFLALLIVPIFTKQFLPDYSDTLKNGPFDGLIQPNNQDNDDIGLRAPPGIVTTTGTRPVFKTVFF